MTDHEINWTIAEQLGWKKHPEDKFIVTDPAYPHSVQPIGSIPDYCNDLNAVHEAEKVLDSIEEWDAEEYDWSAEETYMTNLQQIVARDAFQKVSDDWHFVHATARQRAEAFLRTLGKFKE